MVVTTEMDDSNDYEIPISFKKEENAPPDDDADFVDVENLKLWSPEDNPVSNDQKPRKGISTNHIERFGGTLPSPGRNLEPTVIPRSVSFASKLTNSVNRPTNTSKPERAFVTSTKRQNDAFAYVIDSVDTTSQPGSISSCFSGSHGNLLKLKQSRERNKINRSRTVGEADYKRKVTTDFSATRGHSFSCAAPSNGKLTIDDDLCSLENSEIYTAVSLAGTLTRNAAPSKFKWRWNKYKKLYVIIGVMGVLLVISTTAAVVLAILRC